MQFCCTSTDGSIRAWYCIPFSTSRLFNLIRGMRRECIAILASLRLLDQHAHSHNGHHAADTVYPIRELPPGLLAYKQRTLHYAIFATKEQTQTAVLCPSEHTRQSTALTVYCTLQLFYMHLEFAVRCVAGCVMRSRLRRGRHDGLQV